MDARDPAAPAAGRGPEGTRWRVRSIHDPATRHEVDPPAGVVATARLEGGVLSGTGGCNRYTAGYTLDAATIELGPIASTMRTCPEPLGSFEAAYLQALGMAVRWALTADGLVLEDAGGDLIIRFEADADAPLQGTAWTATAINNGRGGVVSLVADTAVDARFDPDGTVSGGASCNRYRGPYAVDGPTITVGALALTRMACPEPVMAQEGAYIAALGRATTWRIEGDELELRDDGGALQVAFRVAMPAPGDGSEGSGDLPTR